MKRSMYAGRVRKEHVGQEITLKGWVGRRRDLGGLIFIDLRDREGIMQLVINPESVEAEVMAKAESLRSEFVIEVTGTVVEREQAIHYITNEWKESQIKIGAQAYLEKFYQSLSFKPVSEVYLEDDIPHLDMLYSKPVN
ncbi:aspartyl-tRNA synthetase [Streptococcus suis]|nr:aspartyl-tRNA synthetase [Streptococcus suis]